MALLHTDICIVGNELSGFAAGALLARNGHRVVLIDQSPAYEIKMLGDYYAPTFPSFWQIPTTGTVGSVFDTLELRTELRQSFGAKSPLALIFDPHERFIFSPEPHQFEREIERTINEPKLLKALKSIGPHAHDALFKEATHLNESGIWANFKSKKRIARSLNKASIANTTSQEKSLYCSELKPYLESLVPFVQYQAELTLEGIGGFLALNNVLETGQLPFYEHSSAYAVLKSIFAESLLRHGGEVIQEESIKEIKTHHKKITEIHLNGPNILAPKVVIDASYSQAVSSNLSDKNMFESLRKEENLVNTLGQTSIYRFLLPKSLIPRPLPPLGCVLHLENRVPFRTCFGIFHPWKYPYLHQSLDKRPDSNLALVVMANWIQEGDSATGLSRLKQVAEQLFPFALSKRLAEDTIVDEEANYVWPQYSANLKGSNRLNGRPVQTPLKNLLRTGRDVAPALGLNGEIAAAQAVFKAVQKLLQVKTGGFFVKRLPKAPNPD